MLVVHSQEDGKLQVPCNQIKWEICYPKAQVSLKTWRHALGANEHNWLHATYFKDMMQYTMISLPCRLSQRHTAFSDANYTQITSVIAMKKTLKPLLN